MNYIRSGGGFREVGDGTGGKKSNLVKMLLVLCVGLLYVFGFGIGSVSAVQVATDDAKMDYDYKSDYQLTAYAPSAGGINCDNECTYGSMGTAVTTLRTIAVDPDLIPYGSIVAIKFDNGKTGRDDLKKYNGIYLAEDTGGAIKQKRIDVLIEPVADANKFGRVNNVSVAIVEPGKSNRKEAQKLTKERAADWAKYVEKYKDLKVGSVTVGDNEGLKEEKREQAKKDSPFIYGDMQIGNVGVDDRKTEFSNVNEYGAYVFGGKIGNFLFSIAQVMSIVLLGIITFYWLLAFLSFGGLIMASELLHKLTFGKVDVYVNGFGQLAKYTGFAFIVIVVVISGLIPGMFALVYQGISELVQFMSRFQFM